MIHFKEVYGSALIQNYYAVYGTNLSSTVKVYTTSKVRDTRTYLSILELR